jgi:hypothetical protein
MTDNIDLNALTNLTTQQRAGTQNLLAGQNVTSADYLKRYTDFINAQEGATAMAGRIGGELGIPTLQANATMLRNTLTNLPSTYSKATTGYDVNSSQLSRIIGQKASELQPMVQTAETSLEGARSNLNTQMAYNQYDQTRMEKPYSVEQTMLATRLAREATMYSEQNSNELSALIAKINANVTLSEGERNRAQQLAVLEKEFENQKALNLQKQSSSSNYLTVGEGSAVYDPSTGKMIYKNPKTYESSGISVGGDWY